MSFLQAASAKIITNKILNKQVDTDSFGGGRDIHTLTETLRLLLVEEECEAINNCDGKDNNCDGQVDENCSACVDDDHDGYCDDVDCDDDDGWEE